MGINNKKVLPIFWKSGVIFKICTSLKAAKTGGVMQVVDDTVNTTKLGKLINGTIDLKTFTDLWPLMESLGRTSQVGEKALRESVAYLKQCLEDKEVYLLSLAYSLEYCIAIFFLVILPYSILISLHIYSFTG